MLGCCVKRCQVVAVTEEAGICSCAALESLELLFLWTGIVQLHACLWVLQWRAGTASAVWWISFCGWSM